MNNQRINVSSTILLLFCLLITLVSCSRQAVYPGPDVSETNIVIDLSVLQPELPKFYTCTFQGKKINFFTILLNSKAVSFLDACTSCYPQKRGYKYQNGTVVCKDCDMTFSVYKLEKGLGGCYPIKIEGRTDKGKYFIPLTALQSAAHQF